MTRTPVRQRRLALTVIVAAVGAAWAVPAMQVLGGPAEPVPVSRSAYVVREGDTLWSIAERLAPGEDPRPLVDALASANRLDAGTLVPGQMLVVPTGV